jgi:hypothetical protein
MRIVWKSPKKHGIWYAKRELFNSCLHTNMQLFYERRTFSPLRWLLSGVSRCMGRSVKKRNRFSPIALCWVGIVL